MAEIKANGYTQQQLEVLEEPVIYRSTLKALENSEAYISSTELADVTGRPKDQVTGFLDVLRNKNYITGTVKKGEYFWNSKPEKLKWSQVQEILDERPEKL